MTEENVTYTCTLHVNLKRPNIGFVGHNLNVSKTYTIYVLITFLHTKSKEQRASTLLSVMVLTVKSEIGIRCNPRNSLKLLVIFCTLTQKETFLIGIHNI